MKINTRQERQPRGDTRLHKQCSREFFDKAPKEIQRTKTQINDPANRHRETKSFGGKRQYKSKMKQLFLKPGNILTNQNPANKVHLETKQLPTLKQKRNPDK
jgi:hypothetical protein